jgi:multicomponent Na+:H+ antiporter subunit B
LVALLAVLGVGAVLLPVQTTLQAPGTLTDTATAYAEEVPENLGAANVVTGIVVTYRGFDTLGEVSVLFLAATGVGFVLSATAGARKPVGERRGPSEILAGGSAILVPLLLLFGAYIFLHGHITPGGGFQGGVVVAAALVLSVLSTKHPRLSHTVLTAVESLSGAFYVGMGALGIVLASGFLDTTFLPSGTVGTLLSAGAVPIIYALIGVKVGSELTGIIERLRET